MNFITEPMEIENRSFEIIAPHLQNLNLSAEETKIYSRIIHAAGDVEYAPIIKISANAIQSAKNAIQHGANIFTDVEMVRTGINKRVLKKFGGEIFCKVADEEIKNLAAQEKITRSMAAMRSFGKNLQNSIVAIGNAPTALFEVLRLVREEKIFPAVIIGVPVGFVGAADSKSELAKQTEVEFITVEGTKGGSPIAVAAVNAILYLLSSERN